MYHMCAHPYDYLKAQSFPLALYHLRSHLCVFNIFLVASHPGLILKCWAQLTQVSSVQNGHPNCLRTVSTEQRWMKQESFIFQFFICVCRNTEDSYSCLKTVSVSLREKCIPPNVAQKQYTICLKGNKRERKKKVKVNNDKFHVAI